MNLSGTHFKVDFFDGMQATVHLAAFEDLQQTGFG